MRRCYLLIFFLFFFITTTQAVNYHITPTGSGAMDGSSWDDAAGQNSISTFINSRLAPGDRLLIGSGDYRSKIEIKKSGATDAHIVVEGVDTGNGYPIFIGQWSTDNPGSSNGSWAAVSFDGHDHIIVKNLIITQWMYGVNSGKNKSTDIHLDNLFIHHNREGIYLNNVQKSVIKNCTIEMYTKRGIRFDGDVYDVEINNVLTDHNKGDSSWLQEWPFGFMVEEKPNNHSITFLNCRSYNNTQANGTDYWNGDGFCAEKTAYNLRYINCQSYYNADGGWDDKSLAPYLENCIAFGNKRNFRFWNVEGSESTPAWMNNCIGGYAVSAGGSGSSCGVWTHGFLKIEHSTFHNNKSYAISAETDGSHFTVNVENSILSATDYLGNYSPNNLTKAESGATITLNECEKFVTDKTGTDPNYVADAPDWLGDPANAFNSQTFGPAHGYWMGEINTVEYASAAPVEFELLQNYPNPFNPTTTIPYHLNKNAHVTLQIFDIQGRLVSTLIDAWQAAGTQSALFDGSRLPSGLYFYQLTAGTATAVQSMLFIR